MLSHHRNWIHQWNILGKSHSIPLISENKKQKQARINFRLRGYIPVFPNMSLMAKILGFKHKYVQTNEKKISPLIVRCWCTPFCSYFGVIKKVFLYTFSNPRTADVGEMRRRMKFFFFWIQLMFWVFIPIVFPLSFSQSFITFLLI